jgi:nicotinate phosphoribosyltransferase
MFSSGRFSSLLMDFYELTMAQTYFRYRPRAQATFDLFVRQLPPHRSYLLFAGLEDVLRYLADFRFTSRDLDYLAQLGFAHDFLSYLKNLRFSADVWAMPEGSVFFPGEPVLRVTGSLIETQMVESVLLNIVNLSTAIATKASRIVSVAAGRGVYDFSLRRTHGVDASLKAARSAFIAGFDGTSNVLASRLYRIPAVGTMAHSYVMSFSSEEEAFRAFFETFPAKTILLVDTYNTLRGVQKAIDVAKKFKKKGYFLKGIRLDSGDLLKLSKLAKKMLGNAGLKKTRILASGDLDEYKIEKLIAAAAPIDDFGVGTKMGVSSDSPSLDVIYKIAEVAEAKGIFLPAMKFSEKKTTLPGRKQVFRRYGKNGIVQSDCIGLESENLGEPLLQKVMAKGRVVGVLPSLSSIRRLALRNVHTLGKDRKCLQDCHAYPVLLSPGLKKMIKDLSSELKAGRGNK